MTAPLGWLGIVRLGLVQTAIGAIVVLTTSTINRVMVVELALPAILPGLLVALHYAVQILRPRWGHGSDVGGRLTPWIIGGMAVLALGGFGAAAATALMETAFWPGVLLAACSFAAIGMGVGASGTCLLILLSRRVADARRPAAATVVWVMMIAGFIVTAGLVGHALDPFSTGRLVAVSGAVSAIALAVTVLAVRGVEAAGLHEATEPVAADTGFRLALKEVWEEPQARLFAIFIFVSMIAYSAQDLILEPFAGTVFGFTPGESTRLAGVQNGGVLAGMVLVAVVTTLAGSRAGSLRLWAVGGCLASALALAGLALSPFAGGSFSAARHRLRARSRQWRLRGGGDRLDDAARRRGPARAPGRADGALGRGAGRRLRARRAAGRRGDGSRAASHRHAGGGLCRCLRSRGPAFHRLGRSRSGGGAAGDGARAPHTARP